MTNVSSFDEALLECPLCQELLWQPITTSCGHTFCRSCLLRALDHSNGCPLCRKIVSVHPDQPPSVLLQELIAKLAPQALQKREKEMTERVSEQQFNIPLFLLGETTLYPGMPLPLHVFEPRYRLMVRRCLEGSRMFGVVPQLRSANGKLAPFGTAVEIQEQRILPDGRSIVHCVGKRRFRVLKTWNEDGYTVAKVDYFDDLPLDQQDLQSAKKACDSLRMRLRGALGPVLAEVGQRMGIPMPEDDESMVWWVAYMLPASTEDKVGLLEMKSVQARADRLMELLFQQAA